MAATESKYVTLAQNILLEYVYDEDNLKKEDYQIIHNLNLDERAYCSTLGLNVKKNQFFQIDALLKKYSIVDETKYNFLKVAKYSSSYLHYETVRLHLPSTYSFIKNNQIGLSLKIYAYDFDNKKTVNLASYLYDDTKVGSNGDIVFNKEFIYNGQQYGKYLTFDIPSLSEISRQRTNTNTVQENSLNSQLSKIGLNQESPLFFDFSWVISSQNVLGVNNYYLSDIDTKSISNKPEYQTLGVQIEESKDGDYFEIYGTYNQSNESLDDWVDEMTTKGRKIKIDYTISLYEENILSSQQTISVIENFTKKILYRPIITFSNTVAAIDIEMKVIDLFDNSQIIRITSIGITKDIFKYGRTLSRINIDNAFKPKIYNQKVQNDTGNGSLSSGDLDINLTKVNFPVIVDRINVLSSVSPSTTSEYKAMGLANIIINPFGSIFKFNIAATIDGNTIPYDLTKITENSTITLSFKDDTNFLEKEIWRQSSDNDFKLGTIIFKIEEGDLSTIKKISKNNKDFYLTIKGISSGIRTLLYSGKFLFFSELSFLDLNGEYGAGYGDSSGTNGYYDENGNWISGTNSLNLNDFSDMSLSQEELETLLSNVSSSESQTNKNLFVFLKYDADVVAFDKYLDSISASIHFTQSGGNDNCLTYMYFLLNMSVDVIETIKQHIDVLRVVEIDFCIGKDQNNNTMINSSDLASSIAAFNCDI